MSYIMGVDGGNSKTYTVITDSSGKKLGFGIAGFGNHQVNLEVAIKNIRDSINQALNQAHLNEEDIDFVQFGLAGADRERDYKILDEALKKFPFKNWEVVCDTIEGLRTGSPENTGVVLVCGSGTNAAGRNHNGTIVQTGGFGYLYGDGAGVGGHSLAIEAFRTAIRAWEFREEKTVLTEMVPKALGFETVETMFNSFLDNNMRQIPAELSIILHQAAETGDKVSIRILENCGTELGIAGLSVIRRLGLVEKNVRVVLVGSVIQKGKNPYLLNAIESTISKQGYKADFVIPTMAPVYGSMLIGMDHLGIEIQDSIIDQFSRYGGYQDEEK